MIINFFQLISQAYNNQKMRNTVIFRVFRNSSIAIFLSEYYMFKLFKRAVQLESIRLLELQDRLADQESLDTLEMILTNRSGNFFSRNSCIDCAMEEYFCIKDISGQSLEGFNFLDIGAYNGDTILRFVEITNKNYVNIVGIEPDKKSFEHMRIKLEKLAIERAEIINVAVSNISSQKKFDQYGTVGSKLSQSGNSLVNVETIDNLNLKFKNGVFMKIDVEGEELNTINGALEFINLHKPFIAVCLYHKPSDLWEIPLFIAERFPHYKLYLRHHSKGNSETILYAIPGIPL